VNIHRNVMDIAESNWIATVGRRLGRRPCDQKTKQGRPCTKPTKNAAKARDCGLVAVSKTHAGNLGLEHVLS
jgi:hypothetical protein